MYFPKYWARGRHKGSNPKGKEITITAYGWSATSVEEARELGNQRAQKVVERGFGLKQKGEEYEYGTAPFREEVVESVEINGPVIAVISRNRYGALVLNAEQVMFVDIDFPQAKAKGILDAFLLSISTRRREERRLSVRAEVTSRIQDWAKQNPSRSFRLYRTHSGYRILMTDALHDPVDQRTKATLLELKSDPLYRCLTEQQKCFRARLTPKPWRCMISTPPSHFPWDDPSVESEYRDWELGYHQSIKDYSTCRLEEEHGTPADIPEIGRIIELHDRVCLNGDRPLA